MIRFEWLKVNVSVTSHNTILAKNSIIYTLIMTNFSIKHLNMVKWWSDDVLYLKGHRSGVCKNTFLVITQSNFSGQRKWRLLPYFSFGSDTEMDALISGICLKTLQNLKSFAAKFIFEALQTTTSSLIMLILSFKWLALHHVIKLFIKPLLLCK